jgi:hypothetical protein
MATEAEHSDGRPTTEASAPDRFPRMEPDKHKPKPFSQRQSWLLMGTILFVAAAALWLPVFAG